MSHYSIFMRKYTIIIDTFETEYFRRVVRIFTRISACWKERIFGNTRSIVSRNITADLLQNDRYNILPCRGWIVPGIQTCCTRQASIEG